MPKSGKIDGCQSMYPREYDDGGDKIPGQLFVLHPRRTRLLLASWRLDRDAQSIPKRKRGSCMFARSGPNVRMAFIEVEKAKCTLVLK